MTTTAPAATPAAVDEDPVDAALAQLLAERYPGPVTDPARCLYAAACGLQPTDVIDADPLWQDFQDAWSHFGDYDRDQLAVVLGWPTAMDDLEFIDQLHALRDVQAEHRRLQPIAEWLATTTQVPTGPSTDQTTELRARFRDALLRTSISMLTIDELAAMVVDAGCALTLRTGEVLQDGTPRVLADALRPALLRHLAGIVEQPRTTAARDHVAHVLAVALHADCPDDELQHAAGAHLDEAARLVGALTDAGVDVRTDREPR